MPIVYSKVGASASGACVPWIDQFIYFAETGQLTREMKTLGFKAYIPSGDPLLDLTPLQYLKHYRAENTKLIELIETAKEVSSREALKLIETAKEISSREALKLIETAKEVSSREALKLNTSTPAPTTMTTSQEPTPSSVVASTSPENTTTARPPLPTRKSSSVHKTLLTKLRPLPLQYVWAVWHENPSKAPVQAEPTPTSSPDGPTPPQPTALSTSTSTLTSTYSTRLTLLFDSVPDIGVFYKIYNNLPWDSLKLKDSIHIFRAGVKPLWEDPENLDGGAFTLKVRRDDGRAVRAWEEVCLMGCGGELQAAFVEAGITKDHVLGMSYSPRPYWAHITVWTKRGDSFKSVEVLEKMMLERLSPELRPKRGSGEYYYKKHSEHEGWKEAVAGTVTGTR